jgi:hypothetical protein
MAFVALAFAGLVVLGVCAVKVSFAVRALGRELQRTRERLEPKRSALLREAERLDRTRE